MSKSTNLDKSVNDTNNDVQTPNSFVSIYAYNKLSADHENLKLILSNKKKKGEDLLSTIEELNKQIELLSNSLKIAEHQLHILKNKQLSNESELGWKDKCNREIFSALSLLRIEHINREVSDPKAALLRISDTQLKIKELTLLANENKILVLTLCKMLQCDDVKIIQTIKDIIHDNEVIKKRYKKMLQYFEKSFEFTNSLCGDLYRSGLMTDQRTIGSTENNGNNSIIAWENRMAKTRESCLRNGLNKTDRAPVFDKGQGSLSESIGTKKIDYGGLMSRKRTADNMADHSLAEFI